MKVLVEVLIHSGVSFASNVYSHLDVSGTKVGITARSASLMGFLSSSLSQSNSVDILVAFSELGSRIEGTLIGVREGISLLPSLPFFLWSRKCLSRLFRTLVAKSHSEQ